MLKKELNKKSPSDKKDLTKSLEECERLKIIFDTSPNMIVYKDLKGVVIDANEAFIQFQGISKKKIIGMTTFDLLKDQTIAKITAKDDQEVVKTGKSKIGIERKFTSPFSKKEIIGSFSKIPFYNQNNEIVGTVTYIVNITDRVKIEKELEETNKRLKVNANFTEALLSAIPTPVFYKDIQGRYLGCNQAFTDVMGTTSEQVKGKTVMELWPSDLAEVYHKKDLELMKHPKKQVYEFKVKDKKGEVRPVIYAKDVFFDDNKKVAGIIGSFTDITDRVKVEKKLAENEARLRKIFENSAVGVSIVKSDGSWVLVNAALCKITGYSEKELLDKAYQKITYPEDLEITKEATRKLLLGQSVSFEKRYIHKKGKIVWVRINSSPVIDIKGKPEYFVTVTEDINERKRAEEELNKKEEFLEQAENVANLGSYVLDVKTGFWTSSKTLDRIFGINNKYTRSVQGWEDLIHPEDRKMMSDYFANEVLGKHKTFNKVYRIVQNNDKSVHWVHGMGKLEFDSTGEVTSMIGTIQDVTRRKKEELELEQIKNDFLYLVAHQMRTPLSATRWTLETLISEDNFDTKQQDKINNLLTSNLRLINIVNNFLEVTTIESGKLQVKKKEFDISESINNLAESFKSIAGNNNKEIKLNIGSNISKVYADPVLIHGALENIISNAISYSNKKSKDIIITVSEQNGDCLICIHNDGFINNKLAKKIRDMEKFVRGDKAIEDQPVGSGLGLYITHKFVAASGGSLWFESDHKTGTTFYVKIPKK